VPWNKNYGGGNGHDVKGGDAQIVISIFHQVDGKIGRTVLKTSWISEELANFVDHAKVKTGAKIEAMKFVPGMPNL
jgi:hypothetical protein